jgi:hypothetical protein
MLLQLTFFHIYLKFKNLSTYDFVMQQRRRKTRKSNTVGLLIMTGNNRLKDLNCNTKQEAKEGPPFAKSNLRSLNSLNNSQAMLRTPV